MRRIIGTMVGLALLASGILACGSDSTAAGGTGGTAVGGTGGTAGAAGTGGTGTGGTAGTSTGGTGGTEDTGGTGGTAAAGGGAGAAGAGGSVVPPEPYLDDPYYDDPVAFEGAMGYGANATGGRGDGSPDSTALLFVDNLEDSGAGSLRAALGASGTRVIVPRVGGYVQIKSRLTIVNPDYTFLGQLAPGGGLGVRPATLPANHSVFRVSAGNGILRYLTLRASEVGDLSTTPPTYYNQGDAINIGSDATDVIIDHLSAAFATDGIVDISSASRITVQNSLLSFPLEEAGHYEIFHGYATLMTNNSHTSFVYNLISNVRERVPEWGLNPYQQWIHNVVYNYRAGAVIATREEGDTPDVLSTSDFRRNTYKKGPWSNTDKDIRFRNTSGTYGMRCLTYLEGNVSSFVTDPSDLEQQKLMARVLSPNPETTPPDPRDVSEWVVSTSIGTPEIRMMTADESYAHVLDYAGNNRVRDSLDELAVSTVVNDTGLTKMYSTVAEAGGYPAITGGSYPAAADGVIADAWRTWAGETRAWYELDVAGTKRMIIENYADDIAQGRWSPG